MKILNRNKRQAKRILFFCALGLALIILTTVLCPIFFKKSSNFIETFSKNVNEYNLNVSINCENKTLNVNQTTKFVNQTKSVILKSVCFHIYPKAFSVGVVNKPVSSLNEEKAYPNGISYGNVEILSVKSENQTLTTNFLNADKDVLEIGLENALMPNQSITINFEYNLSLPNIFHRYGYGESTINLGNFFLIACVYDENEGFFTNSYHYNGDPFYSEISNFNAKVSYDKNYTLASTGTIQDEKIDGDTKITTISAKAVRDFALILSDKFKKISSKIENTTINYFYYSDEKPQESLKTCEKALKTFNNLFAKYPYAQLSVCESNFVYGGMEYPNLVFISDDQPNYEDYTYTIVHEIAHQWWYNLVGNNEYKYGFLDEGLTEYSTYLFFEENEEYGLNTKEMIKNTTNSYVLFLDVYSEVFSKVNTSMLRSLNEFNTEPEYVYISYVKGVLMFDNLKDIVGKTKFLKSLKIYFNENQGKNAVPADLISAFSKGCGQNLESYFNSWFNGSVVIESL